VRELTVPVDLRPLLTILAVEDAMAGDLSWRDKARCAEVDPDLFFVERGCSPRPAKRICAGCEVRPQCLEYALETDQTHGVWGGTSELDRRRMRKQAAA
jgi:WhiB family redox-sensing transcriptional regulator